MKFKQRKKYQRFLNKQIKDLNKSVEVDELWKGRFFIRQIQSDWIEFDDHSGGILKACLEFRDKKTKLTWRGYFNIFDIHCLSYLYSAFHHDGSSWSHLANQAMMVLCHDSLLLKFEITWFSS